MENNVQQILNEIYQLDSSLKKRETELIKIIQTMLAQQPQFELDQTFVANLRQQLASKTAATLANEVKKNTWFEWLKPVAVVGASLVVLLIVAWPWLKFNKPQADSNLALNLKVEINQLQPGAFGNLASSLLSSQADDQALNVREVKGLGGGGNVTTPAMPVIDSQGTKEMSMIYQPTIFEFNYLGQELEQTLQSLDVLKRVKGGQAGQQLGRILQGLNFEMLNLKAFTNLEITNLSAVEKKDKGYSLAVSTEEGRISLYQNWQTWPTLEIDCRGDDCNREIKNLVKNYLIQPQELIHLSDQFLQEHGVDLSSYGPGEIQPLPYWIETVDYVSDYLSVIYPLQINGLNVYDQRGFKQGIEVSLNLRQQAVSSVNNLETQIYQSSSYNLETDIQQILKYAQQGGANPMYKNEDSQIVQINIDTPELAYIKIWRYENNQSDELLVPAWVFPIINKPQNEYFYQEKVVVPLAKDFWQQEEIYGPIRLMQEGVEIDAPVPAIDKSEEIGL
ncbi:MAG: hypothetical protein PHS07_02575 [Patescibacteria group bacterium]|nr:hypothetical protein [Patescibacteria group bacterium]